MRRAIGFFLCWTLLQLIPLHAEDDDQRPSSTDARKPFLTGKYDEAIAACQNLQGKEPLESALGLARCQLVTGDPDAAIKILTAAAKAYPKDARLPAELAQLAFERGDHNEAQKHVKRSLELDSNSPLARWVQAELYRTSGRMKEADAAYKWFVDHFNAQEIRDSDTLRLVGRAAAQYARWNRLADQFHFLVNDLYPGILALDKNYWPAHYEAGLLYLEKFNAPEATRQFNRALAINPNAAEVHAALAALALQDYEIALAKSSIDRALEINPNLLWARQLQADLQLANFESRQAIELLNECLQLNPRDETTLGRLAAAHVARDGFPALLNHQVDTSKLPQPPTGTALAKLVAEVNRHNPHAGDFYNAAGDALDLLHRYPQAGRFYAEAIRRMPQLVAPYGQLGLIQMRLGHEAAAQKTLAKAFKYDPFNVRVNNSLAVLEVLSGYATLETEHFVIRYDRAQDEALARLAAQSLEEDVYPSLTRRLGYELKEKSLFEFFSRAKNTDGHGWFSARMVGLPYVGTVGACAGGVVAMHSPNDAKKKFNWARVLRHEFVHVVNLQQTGFNIPHWFTEALAVHIEELSRPQIWDQVLVERAREGKLYTLDTINVGFLRPKSSADWHLAYCQSELYAEYLLAQFGDDSLSRLLAAYADNLTTEQAIERAFQVTVADFERGYQQHVAKLVATLNQAASAEELSIEELEESHADKSDDPEIAARLAHAHLRENHAQRARALADRVLKVHPNHQLANYVVARLRLKAGETGTVIEQLEKCLDRADPEPNTLSLLAGLRLKSKEYDAAAALYELGRQKYPGDKSWTQALARVYLQSGDDVRLAPVLAELANADFDNLPFRRKLAQLARDKGDHRQAARWAREATHIDTNDAEMHRIVGHASLELDDPRQAVTAFELAKLLDPQDLEGPIGLVRAYQAVGQTDRARVEYKDLERLAPDDDRVKELQSTIEPPPAKP